MKVAIVAALIDGIQPTLAKPVKKMSVVELDNYPNDDDFTILHKFEKILKEEYEVKDLNKAGIIVRANIVMRANINPETSMEDICTDILLEEFFAKYMREKLIVDMN